MPLPLTVTMADPWGQMTVRRVEDRILESVYTGYCSAALVREVLAVTPGILREAPGASCLLDMRLVTGNDPASAAPGRAIMKLAREAGGERFAVLHSSGLLRMAVAATAFATGLPLKAFDGREEALVFLRGERGGGGTTAPPVARRP